VNVIEQEVADALRAYADDLTRKDAAAAADRYQIPCLFLNDRGPVVFTRQHQLVARFSETIEHLAVTDYTGSSYTSIHVRALGDRTALVSATAVQYAAGGRESERIGATYLMYRTDAAWKIAGIVGHPADRAVPLE
jgi:ketosteroid isomerase-like protein